MSPAISMTNTTSGAVTNIDMSFQIPVDIPVNATVHWELPPPFKYVDLQSCIPSISIDNAAVDFSFSRNSISRLVVFNLANNYTVPSSTSLRLTLTNIKAPPSTGLHDSYQVFLYDADAQILTTVSATASPIQPSLLYLGYVGVEDSRSRGDAGLMVAFSTSLDIPSNGGFIIDFNEAFQIGVNASVRMFNSDGSFSLTTQSNRLKIQRNGDGNIISSGSTIVFWLTSFINPFFNGPVSPGTLRTSTSEDFTLEQANLTAISLYAGIDF